MKKLLLSTMILFELSIPVYAEEAFNLTGIIEGIINYQASPNFVNNAQIDSKENYLYALQNMNNGNVVVAYSEFQRTIESLDKNISLLMVAKKMYELGFFSLADIALSKISTQFANEDIAKLKTTYMPSYKLSKEEEIYLAKAYASIFYNNSPEEVAFGLVKKNSLMDNSDYANYIMANAMFQCKQYNQALTYINKAILKNNLNSNYKLFKAKILVEKGQLKDTLKYISNIENSLSVFALYDLKILEQKAYMKNAQDEIEKKYHQIYIYYIEGNYYKVLKETQNVLTFNKNNPEILTLQGMAHLALGEKNEAMNDFQLSYKLDKKSPKNLIGLGDINFMNGNYKEALNYYKKAFNTKYNKEAVIKSSAIYEVQNSVDKKAVKLYKLRDSLNKNAFFEYYLLASNIFYNDKENQKKYMSKSLGINVLHVNSWDVLLEDARKNNDYANLSKLVFMLSFLDLKNPEYYYYSALCLDISGKKKDAFYEAKKAVLISPDYKPAQELINRLEQELI